MKMQIWKKRFFIIWTGQTLSLLSGSVVQYAILWHLTASTGSAAVLSGAALLCFLPTALFGPLIGSLADRWNKKAVMIASDLTLALSALAMIAADALGLPEIPVLFTALFVRALATAFRQTCLTGVTPLLVPRQVLSRCGGAVQALQSVSMILSPGLAAMLYSVFSLPWTAAADLFGGLADSLILLTVRFPRGLARHRPASLKAGMLRGFQMLSRKKGVFSLALITGLFALACVPSGSLYPLMVQGYFGKGPYHTGLAEMAYSMGMLLSGLVLGLYSKVPGKLRFMSLSAAVTAAALWGMGLLPKTAFAAFVAFTFVTGLAAPFFFTLFMVLLQENIPARCLGRAVGAASSLTALMCPLGLAASGLWADSIGVSGWFFISGCLAFLCALLVLRVNPGAAP